MARAPDPEAPAPLPRVVVRLGWISFCLDAASEMVIPVLPLFLASVLAEPAGALGAVEGVPVLVLSLMVALAGFGSDRLRRRVPFIRLGYGLAAASKPLLALAGSWPAVLSLRTMDRFGKGLRTAPRDALIAEASAALADRGPGRTGSSFGFHRAMDTAGALTGVLLAALLLHLVPGQYRTIFALTAIPGAVAVALTFTLRETGPAVAVPAAPLRLNEAVRRLPASWWAAVGVVWIVALGSPATTFFLLRTSELGLGDTRVVLAYAVFNLTYALCAWPAGRLSDRLGRRPVLALGWLLFAAVHAGFALLDSASVAWLLAALGVSMGLTEGVARAWIADRSPVEVKATALGLFQLGSGLGLLASSLLAGWAWTRYGASVPFAVAGAVVLAGLLLLPLVPGLSAERSESPRRRRPPAPPRS